MKHYWTQHFKRLRESLVAQISRARSASSHPSIKGGCIEAVLRRTLEEYLPGYFCVGTGQIANNRNKISPQLDIMIYDAGSFPHLAVNEDSSVIICCEPLLAAVECKTSWNSKKVATHYKEFKKVETKRHKLFANPELAAGYFVFIVKPSSPTLTDLEDDSRFIGVYSLESNKAWASHREKIKFKETGGNALELFFRDVLYECMRKGMVEPGTLEWSYEVMSSYLSWPKTARI